MVRPVAYVSVAVLSALISTVLYSLMPTHGGFALLASQSPGLLGLVIAGSCLDNAGRWRLSHLSFASLLGVSIVTLVSERKHVALLSIYFIQSLGLFGFIFAGTCSPHGWRKWAVLAVSFLAFMFPNFMPFDIKQDFHFGNPKRNGYIDNMWEPVAFRSCLGVTVYTICVFVVLSTVSMARQMPKVMYRLKRWRDKRWRHPTRLLVDDFSVVASGDCAICLDKLENDEGNGILRLSCQHCFHMNCISDWQDKSGECPVCRRATPDIRDCTHLLRQANIVPGRHAMETRQLHVLGDDAPLVPPLQPSPCAAQEKPQSQSPLIQIPMSLRAPQPQARLPAGVSDGSLYASLNNV